MKMVRGPLANDQILPRTSDNGPISPEDVVRSFGHWQDSKTTIWPITKKIPRLQFQLFENCAIADVLMATRSFYVSASGVSLLKPDCWQDSHTVIVRRLWRSEMWRDCDEKNCDAIVMIRNVTQLCDEQNCPVISRNKTVKMRIVPRLQQSKFWRWELFCNCNNQNCDNQNCNNQNCDNQNCNNQNCDDQNCNNQKCDNQNCNN